MASSLPNDPGKPVPYYEQVANILRGNIISNEDDQPVRLPPERDLCRIHQVSRITVRKALELLEQEGLVQRTPGRGTLTVPTAIQQYKRLRQSRVIHVLTGWQHLADVPMSFYGQIYQGIFDRAEKNGYRLSIQELMGSRISAASDLFLPDKDTTLGTIFIGLMNETMVNVYTQAGYTVACIDYWTTNPNADAIVVDCYSEGQIVADFLIRQGHTNLFYLGNLLGRFENLERESDAELIPAGMQRALGLARLPLMPPEQVRYYSAQPGNGAAAAEWFLSLSPRPTAGVIFHAGLCQEFIRRLAAQGVRCPEDVSLISKSWDADPRDIGLLRCDARLMGQLAVDCLLDRATGKRSSALRLALPSRLTPGKTVRPT